MIKVFYSTMRVDRGKIWFAAFVGPTSNPPT